MTDQTSRAPRTDAAEFKATRIGSNLPEYVVCSDEARTLELEAADLRERLAKAREALETLQSIGTPQHYDYRRIAALIDRITAALAEKDDGGWIKCSERLPDEGDYVLAVWNGLIVVVYRVGNSWADGDETISAPTHWRPLPPLPKGDKQ